jgi:hypothetical protein
VAGEVLCFLLDNGGMYTVELYARVRRAVAREFGLARKTVEKMLEYSLPPGYRRRQSARRPKLGPWLGLIDAIVEDDRQRPPKQRHTVQAFLNVRGHVLNATLENAFRHWHRGFRPTEDLFQPAAAA